VISPDLTRGKPGRSKHTGHTITALAESSLKAGLLYVGTDDGRIHVTNDDGGKWTELTDKVPDVPAARWITRIECSRFAEGTAYLTLDRHRQDDRAPYLFKTTDYGASWRPLAGNLPREGPIYVIREDPRNSHLLYVGTEFGLYLSADAGRHWQRLENGFPTVAVHDLLVHPRDRELVMATHGRGVFVLDVAPLQEWTLDLRDKKAHLFEVKPATQFLHRGYRNWKSSKVLAAANPPFGASIYYYLKDAQSKPVQVIITDRRGNKVWQLKAEKEAGFHRVEWALSRITWQGMAPLTEPVAPGRYFATLKIGNRVYKQRIHVEAEE
jgi:hypothetical protein